MLLYVEEYGRHLPVGVDFYETQKWIEDAAPLLAENFPDDSFGILPVIPLGYADMGEFPGNIHVPRKLIFDVVYQTLSAVSKWGVKNIIVISGHADPLHTIAIEQACETINQEKGLISIAPMGTILNLEEKGIVPTAPPAVQEKSRCFPNDFHAGWIETSSMLDIAPHLVKPTYMERPDVSISARDMGTHTKVIQAIQNEGHIGFPKEADSVLGVGLNQDIAYQIREAGSRFIRRTGYECYQNHPLSHIPGMKIEL